MWKKKTREKKVEDKIAMEQKGKETKLKTETTFKNSQRNIQQIQKKKKI